MKIKNLKKTIKKNLFNKSMSENLFMIFEINNNSDKKSQVTFESTTFFSKQVLNKALALVFQNLKYPIVVKSTSFLPNIFNHVIYLTNKNYICNVFFIKMYFILFKFFFVTLIHIFDKKECLLLLNNLLISFIKKKKMLKLCHTLICPFINLDNSHKNLLNK